MGYTGFERLWLFFAFSFFGWVLETVTAAVRQRRFVNRGLVNGPFCVLYGITGTAMLVVCRELHGIWLFLGSMIFSTLAEWIAGHVIERMYHERWWDYSHMKWNLDGYICVPVSIVWGVLGAATMRWGAPVLVRVFRDAPADSGASDCVDSGGCAGDGCHGDLMYLIRQKPQNPPVGRRGFLAHRCELKA